MKIHFESSGGKYSLHSLYTTSLNSPIHNSVNDCIKEAEFIWALGGYTNDFQVIDMETGEIIVTLEYEPPVVADYVDLYDMNIQMLNTLRECCKSCNTAFHEKETTKDKQVVRARIWGSVDFAERLLAKIGDAKEGDEKTFSDMFAEVFGDTVSKWGR